MKREPPAGLFCVREGSTISAKTAVMIAAVTRRLGLNSMRKLRRSSGLLRKSDGSHHFSLGDPAVGFLERETGLFDGQERRAGRDQRFDQFGELGVVARELE